MHLGSGPHCSCHGCRQINWSYGARVCQPNSLVNAYTGLGLGDQVGFSQAQANQALWASAWPREPITRADLGIVDELLDDKVGMDL